MSIVWLASYPKSGNTWLRAVLTNYLRDDGEPASINALVGGSVASDRETFSEIVGLDASDLTPEEILRHRPLFHELLARELAELPAGGCRRPTRSAGGPSREHAPAFVKVHDAYLHTRNGAALFPKVATSGVVYLVRNPLDVAVSYAHHRQKSIDDTMRWMNEPAAAEGEVTGGIHTQLPQPLTTWSGHVASWLDQEELPVHVARYEDLLADPMAGFGAIVRFAGLDRDGTHPEEPERPSATERLARAIGQAAFSRLRTQEEDSGFSEKQSTAPSFFRAGVAGSWRTALAPRQVQALVDAHGPVMARLGYLREAEAFLAGNALVPPPDGQAEPARGGSAARGAGLSCTGTLGKSPGRRDGEFRVSRPLRDYRAYGLWVRSAIALPFVPVPVPPAREPDVTVRIGATAEALPTPADKRGLWEAAPGAFLMDVPGVARYLVTDGRDILVEPHGGSDHGAGVFLTGSMFSALLQQRGVTTFHASAIETDSGVVLFAGRSGSGKSSLLAALVERGYPMLADDVAGVVPDAGGHPVALSAFPHMRLWANALDELGWRKRTRGKVREALEKYLVPVERFRAEPLAVHAVCVLTSHHREDVEVETVSRAVAFRWLCEYTYHKRRLHGLGQQPAHFRTVTAMVRRVPVARVARPAHPFRLDALADRIEEHLREMRRQGAAGGQRPLAGTSREQGRRPLAGGSGVHEERPALPDPGTGDEVPPASAAGSAPMRAVTSGPPPGEPDRGK